jgi:DNA-binding GntR family transcriptional regulator
MRLARILFDATDQPLALEEVVLPLERFPGLSLNDGGDVPDIIELVQRHGISLGRAMERVSIVQATKDVAAHLGIAAGANVMKLDRVVETADGEPAEWRVAYRKI